MDWEEVYRRIEAARIAIEKGFQPAREGLEKVLRERAMALAVETREDGDAGEYIEVVEFLLAHEKYGIETKYVREVCPLADLTPVPCTPQFVSGIINVRGEIVSVIDIKRFFDLPDKGISDMNKVIVLHSGEVTLGILVDAISGVRDIPLTAIETGLPTLTGIREEYLKGVTKERDVILDAWKLLSDRRVIVDGKVDT